MNEKEKEAIEKLKERVKIDRQLRDKVESDFDKFCEDECIAIETVLNLIDKQNKVIDEMANDIYNSQMECNRYFKDKEEVKQYFIRKEEENGKNSNRKQTNSND